MRVDQERHLSKILEKKIKRIKLINAKDITENIVEELNNVDCLIIDNFENNINENLLFYFKSIETT